MRARPSPEGALGCTSQCSGTATALESKQVSHGKGGQHARSNLLKHDGPLVKIKLVLNQTWRLMPQCCRGGQMGKEEGNVALGRPSGVGHADADVLRKYNSKEGLRK